MASRTKALLSNDCKLKPSIATRPTIQTSVAGGVGFAVLGEEVEEDDEDEAHWHVWHPSSPFAKPLSQNRSHSRSAHCGGSHSHVEQPSASVT
jgi:hypothetical protein